MANYGDFTRTSSTEDLLDRMWAELPDLGLDYPSHVIAGLLWLDNANQLTQEGDYVLLDPSLAAWLSEEVTIGSPEINQILDRLRNTEDETEETRLALEFEQLTAKPFIVTFKEGTAKTLQGKKVLIAIKTFDEAEIPGTFGATLRADGTLIGPAPYKRQLA